MEEGGKKGVEGKVNKFEKSINCIYEKQWIVNSQYYVSFFDCCFF